MAKLQYYRRFFVCVCVCDAFYNALFTLKDTSDNALAEAHWKKFVDAMVE